MIKLSTDLTGALRRVASILPPNIGFYCFRQSGELLSNFDLQIMMDTQLWGVEAHNLVQRIALNCTKDIND
jgi:hypothetical protein